jgi:hypothetical protein
MPVWKPPQSEIGTKIQELAKKAPLSWIAPDPYDPSSIVTPIGGMTKVAFTKQLRGILGKSKALDQLIEQTPKKAIDFLNKVRFSKEIAHSGEYKAKEIALGKTADLQTVLHEVEHAIEDWMSTRLKRSSNYPLYKSEFEALADEFASRRAKNLNLPYEISAELPKKLEKELNKYENPYLFLKRYLSQPKWGK